MSERKMDLSAQRYNELRREMFRKLNGHDLDTALGIGAEIAQLLFRHFAEALNPTANGYTVDYQTAPLYAAAIIAAAEATKNAIGSAMPENSQFENSVAGIVQVNLNSVESVSFLREDDSDD